MSEGLEELGRLVAAESDASADPDLLASAKRRALGSWTRRRRAASARTRLAVGAAVAALALALFLFAFGSRRAPSIAFTVAGEPTAVGAWIAAGDESVPMAFSEGSTVLVRPGTRVRVTGATERGAALSLEQGAVEVRVAHRQGDAAWSFYAGPFTVKVVGTAFLLVWDGATEELTLEMREGSVSVSGPVLDQERSVRSGERLHVRHRQAQLSLVRGAPDETSMLAPGETSAPPGSPGSSESPQPSAAPEPKPRGRPSAPASAGDARALSWKELARAGRHREAMAAVEGAGFDGVLERASDADLLVLADLARFAGHHGRAQEALLAVRRRGARGTTAFLLGRLASDHLGAPAEALRWFRTYLAEEPRGALREQALGRIVEVSRRSGDDAAARRAAEAYLDEFPDGTYAGIAHRALGR